MNTFEDDELDVTPLPKATATTATPAATAAAAHTAAASTAPAPAKAVEDDLDTPPSKASDKPKPAAETASKPVAKTAAADDDENMDAEFGDDKLANRPNQLPRCRPAEKGRAVRFALLNFIKPKQAKSHFVEVPGKKLRGRCLTGNDAAEAGYCCNKLAEDGELHVVAPVLRYTNADSKTGGLEKGQPIDWEIQYVDLTRSNYRQVSHLIDELIEDNPNVTVYDIDIVMTHDPDRAFGYNFKRIAQKARWKQNPELVKEVREAAEPFLKDDGKILKQRLGKKLSLAEWKALLSSGAAGAQDVNLSDVDEL